MNGSVIVRFTITTKINKEDDTVILIQEKNS